VITRFLVELTPPEDGFEAIEAIGARSRAASDELSRAGTPVRFLRTVFVPEDGSCLLVIEGASAEAVREACGQARLVAARVSPTLELTEDGAQAERDEPTHVARFPRPARPVGRSGVVGRTRRRRPRTTSDGVAADPCSPRGDHARPRRRNRRKLRKSRSRTLAGSGRGG
jgi:hypothetical protein